MENAVGRLYVEAAFAGESKHVVMFSEWYIVSYIGHYQFVHIDERLQFSIMWLKFY